MVVVDALTYAGNLDNLGDLLASERLRFVRADIVDGDAMLEAGSGAAAIVNFAAESHVDRSIHCAAPFIRTNVLGTQVLLDASRELGIPRFLQISTDEVYGSLGPTGRFTESTPLKPSSPYSASKASADLLVRAAARTHGVRACILRSSNAFGPYQFPEKLIPLMISRALERRELPVYGDGLHVRDWIHVEDLVRAVLAVLEHGEDGEVYNVGGGSERTNLEVVRSVLRLTGRDDSLIRFVEDRPGHDRRYAMDFAKITETLGWEPELEFTRALEETVRWYEENVAWLESVRSGEYLSYYDRQYADRPSGDALA